MRSALVCVIIVALRKESVDRNASPFSIFWICRVALRKESVDRNVQQVLKMMKNTVALRKESVDRNLVSCIDRAIDIMSLSARRAWIEIFDTMQIVIVVVYGRSPQGERG